MTDLLRKLDGDPIYGYIYCIQNRLNGKIYFGQTINNFKRRYSKGISKTHNQHLSNSISKYGIENFTINEHFDVAHSMQELNELEEMYIKMYQTTNAKYGYNKKQGGDNKKYTQESKDKISRALMGKYSYENNPKATGHGGIDYALLEHFFEAILKGEPAPISLKEGLCMTLPGIYAEESAKRGGKLLRAFELYRSD